MSKYKVGDKVLIEGEITKDAGHGAYCIEAPLGYRPFWVNEDDMPNNLKTYEDGLADAWELALKVSAIPAKGGIPHDDCIKMFGTSCGFEIIRNNTPSEALSKIEAYEKSKQIQVGDVVDHQGLKGVVTRVSEDCIHVLTCYGTTPHYTTSSGLKKTGRHIDISNLLEQIRGDDMTEQDAIELLKRRKVLSWQGGFGNYDEAEQMAIKALEEIQQYRVLGTVEELRVARDKQVAKKPSRCVGFTESMFRCPSCGRKQPIMYEQYHCKECGQKLDWEEV